jgi:AbrB family looped-hinge helix DNA binding protein
MEKYIMRSAKVSSKGAVVIPAELRAKLGIKPGSKVYFLEVNGALQIVPVPKDPIKALRGSLKGGKPLTESLKDGREEDRRHEEWLEQRFGGVKDDK